MRPDIRAASVLAAAATLAASGCLLDVDVIQWRHPDAGVDTGVAADGGEPDSSWPDDGMAKDSGADGGDPLDPGGHDAGADTGVAADGGEPDSSWPDGGEAVDSGADGGDPLDPGRHDAGADTGVAADGGEPDSSWPDGGEAVDSGAHDGGPLDPGGHDAGAAAEAEQWCWQNPLPQGDQLFSVWSFAPRDDWAVGAGGTAIHRNGSAWTSLPSGTSQALHAVAGIHHRLS